MRLWTRLAVAAVAATPLLLIASPADAATPVALWHMDDPSVMTDSSGNVNDGTTTAITGVQGFSGNGYHFNGTTSRVDVPSSASLNPGTADFSATAHVRFDTSPLGTVGDYDLVRKGLSSAVGGEWKMEIFPASGSLISPAFCLFKDANAAVASIRGNNDLADGQWHAITCAKTSTSISLTVDGATVTKSVRLGSISNSAPVTVGYKLGGGDQYLGDMDEVSIDVGSTGTGGDTIAPTVTARSPAPGATGVSVTANTTATFSEPVQGVSTTTFTLTDPNGATVPATVTQSTTANTWILNPNASLAGGTTYRATLTGGTTAISDLAGNPLTTTTWTFTTAADTTAPTVTGKSPAANATGIAVGVNVTATFSELVQGVGTSTFTLTDSQGATVAATVTQSSTNPRRWILNPNASLARNSTYTATLTGGATGIRDLAGNPLASISWRFTTAV